MANRTKEKILDTALTMFSAYGYAGTSMRDLADALGLSKAALYKHFESKEEIWDTLIDTVEAYYTDNFGSPEHRPETPSSPEMLVELTMRMVDFTVHDRTVIKVRKLLLTEQFRDERAGRLVTKHFLTGLEEMFTAIFREMMARRILKKDDPAALAFAYVTPVSALIQLCDREPEREEEVMDRIREFAERFVQSCSVKHRTKEQ